MVLRLALRNVFRNRRRTLFSLAVLVVSMSILFVVLAFQGEFLRATRLSLACETGAVQIADERLFDGTTSGYEYLISPELDHANYKRDLVGAIAFDRLNGLVYVVERLGDGYKSVIHIWRIIP